MFDWDRSFTNSNSNDMVDIYTKIIQNILLNFIPREKIEIDDKDHPY